MGGADLGEGGRKVERGVVEGGAGLADGDAHEVHLKLSVPPPHSGIGPQHATLRWSWWTISEEDHLQMHAFTRPSHQLGLKFRDTLLRDLHQTSLYRRLILINKERGAHIMKVGKAIHSRLMSNHWEGTTLLELIYGQL